LYESCKVIELLSRCFAQWEKTGVCIVKREIITSL
jgi:hypothetical protein